MQRASRPEQRLTLLLLFLAGLVNFLDRASLSVANGPVRAELHLNATEMGWLLSAFSLAYGIAQLPLIGLLDRAGTRAVLGTGLFVWSAAQLLTSFAAGIGSFLGLRVLLGLGESPYFPSAVRSLRERFPPASRGRATAVMNSSQTIGLAIAPPLLTAIMLRSGWRHMFLLLGAAGLLVAVLWIAFHRPLSPTTDAIPAPVSPAPTASHPLTPWLSLLRHRTVWGMMLGWGGVNYTVWLYISWLPGYLETQRHLSLAHSGWLAAIPFLVGSLGMFASGFLSDARECQGRRLPAIHRANLIAGMTLSAACTFFVAHAGSTSQAVAGISLALFFIHFAGTSGWGYVQAVSPTHQVASLGALQNFASFMIASAAPVITGFLLDRTRSFTLALAVCSGVTLLGALSYLLLASDSPLDTITET